MTVINKIKWVLGILMIFVLIIATNLIDRNNFLRVKDSVSTIYEDRLVVNDIIFDFSTLVQEKEIAALTMDSTFYANRNTEINNKIENLVLRYGQTKLTKEEDKVFNEFKDNLALLNKQESSFVQSGMAAVAPLERKIIEVKENLYDLSKIQLREGRRQTDISKKAVNTVELFTQLEIYVLIFLAIIVQIIVIYSPRENT